MLSVTLLFPCNAKKKNKTCCFVGIFLKIAINERILKFSAPKGNPALSVKCRKPNRSHQEEKGSTRRNYFSKQFWTCPNTFCRSKLQLVVLFLSFWGKFNFNIKSFLAKSNEAKVSNALFHARRYLASTHTLI